MAVYDMVRAKAAAAKKAAAMLAVTDTAVKNKALAAMAAALEEKQQARLAAKAEDMRCAAAGGMKVSMLDRLKLTEERIAAMAAGLRQLAALPDPVGWVLGGSRRPIGLTLP